METLTKPYTPSQANRALPLVRRIVDDILEQAREVRALAELSGEEDPERDPEVRASRKEVNRLLDELADLGLEFKDPQFETGLVDFPAEIDGKPVLLCWSPEEASVTHFHGVAEGFAARRPIPAELLETDDA